MLVPAGPFKYVAKRKGTIHILGCSGSKNSWTIVSWRERSANLVGALTRIIYIRLLISTTAHFSPYRLLMCYMSCVYSQVNDFFVLFLFGRMFCSRPYICTYRDWRAWRTTVRIIKSNLSARVIKAVQGISMRSIQERRAAWCLVINWSQHLIGLGTHGSCLIIYTNVLVNLHINQSCNI